MDFYKRGENLFTLAGKSKFTFSLEINLRHLVHKSYRFGALGKKGRESLNLLAMISREISKNARDLEEEKDCKKLWNLEFEV